MKKLLENWNKFVVEQKEMPCPAATQDLELNTENRDAAIQAEHIQYGPLNVDEPGDYWKDIAEYWNTTEEAAQKSLCGNCVAFDISPRMDECMPGETSDDDGRLGYCWMHKFKCHSARSCRTWAKGGPITEDKTSYDWQERNQPDMEEGKICPKGIAWAKRNYDKWPSAYASMGASKYCKDPNYGKGKKKDESLQEDELDECWSTHERVPGTKKGAPGSCRKKTNESEALEEKGDLAKWRDEKWVQSDGTPCGDAKAQKSPKRCKPKSKWATMSKGEKAADNKKKKAGGKKGKQFVSATKKGKVTKSHTKESKEMKISKSKLEQIIREEVERLFEEDFYEVDAIDLNEEYCPVCREAQEIEEEKKKPCKPSKGKRLMPTVLVRLVLRSARIHPAPIPCPERNGNVKVSVQ